MYLSKQKYMVQSLRRSKSFRILFNSPELVEEQRSGFHHFLKHGIAEELSKISFLEVKRQNVDIEVFLDANTFQLIAPDDNSRNCIIKMKTYACKLYVQIRIVWKKKSGGILMQTEPEWVLLAHLPMMTKRGHFVINGSPRVIVHQVVRAPGVYFQKFGKVKKDERNKARFYGDIIPRKGVWVRLQISKTGQVEIKLKKSTKVQAEMVERCLAVIEKQELSKSRNPQVELLLAPLGLNRDLVPATSKFKRFFLNQTEVDQMSNRPEQTEGLLTARTNRRFVTVRSNVSQKIADCLGQKSKQHQIDHSTAWVHRAFGLLLGCFASSAELAAGSDRVNTVRTNRSPARLRFGNAPVEFATRRVPEQNRTTGFVRAQEQANREFAQQPKRVNQNYRPRSQSMAITGISKPLGVAKSVLLAPPNFCVAKVGQTDNKPSVCYRAQNLRFCETYELQNQRFCKTLDIQPTACDHKHLDNGLHIFQNRTFVVRAHKIFDFVRPLNVKKVRSRASACSGPLRGPEHRPEQTEGLLMARSRSASNRDVVPAVKNLMPTKGRALSERIAPFRSRLWRDHRAGSENSIAITRRTKATLLLEATARQSRAGKDLSDKFTKAELKGDDRAFTNVYDNLYRVPEMKELEDKMYPKGCYISIDTEFKRDFSYKHIFATFKAPWRYSLGKVGRYKLNKKFGLDLTENQLTSLDIQAARNWLYRLRDGKEIIDDIDHFQNRRVRQSGELIQNQFENGVTRLRKLVRRKLRTPTFESLPFGQLWPPSSPQRGQPERSSGQEQTEGLYVQATGTTFRQISRSESVLRSSSRSNQKMLLWATRAQQQFGFEETNWSTDGRSPVEVLTPFGSNRNVPRRLQTVGLYRPVPTNKTKLRFAKQNLESKPTASPNKPSVCYRSINRSKGLSLFDQFPSGRQLVRSAFDEPGKTWPLEPAVGRAYSGKTSNSSFANKSVAFVRVAQSRPSARFAPETAGFVKLTRTVGVISLSEVWACSASLSKRRLQTVGLYTPATPPNFRFSETQTDQAELLLQAPTGPGRTKSAADAAKVLLAERGRPEVGFPPTGARSANAQPKVASSAKFSEPIKKSSLFSRTNLWKIRESLCFYTISKPQQIPQWQLHINSKRTPFHSFIPRLLLIDRRGLLSNTWPRNITDVRLVSEAEHEQAVTNRPPARLRFVRAVDQLLPTKSRLQTAPEQIEAAPAAGLLPVGFPQAAPTVAEQPKKFSILCTIERSVNKTAPSTSLAFIKPEQSSLVLVAQSKRAVNKPSICSDQLDWPERPILNKDRPTIQCGAQPPIELAPIESIRSRSYAPNFRVAKASLVLPGNPKQKKSGPCSPVTNPSGLFASEGGENFGATANPRFARAGRRREQTEARTNRRFVKPAAGLFSLELPKTSPLSLSRSKGEQTFGLLPTQFAKSISFKRDLGSGRPEVLLAPEGDQHGREQTFGLLLSEAEQVPRNRAFKPASELFSTKPINGALREFFGSNPLSQYMDQTNPLAEVTHKRRISSLGIGGVSRESAGMAIRGIHPTHYGRICPIETPEGKNAGLVNSLALYARLNKHGFIETPYYKVIKGQVQEELGFSFYSALKETVDRLHLAPSDLQQSQANMLGVLDRTVNKPKPEQTEARTNLRPPGGPVVKPFTTRRVLLAEGEQQGGLLPAGSMVGSASLDLGATTTLADRIVNKPSVCSSRLKLRPRVKSADSACSAKLSTGSATNFVQANSGCLVPVRVADTLLDVFKKVSPYEVDCIGISPVQILSVATSLIPFLEHNDANRALMGSNMQRQAVPLMISERPIVGTGLEALIAAESGQLIQSSISGLVSHVSANKIIIERLFNTAIKIDSAQQNNVFERDQNNPTGCLAVYKPTVCTGWCSALAPPHFCVAKVRQIEARTNRRFVKPSAGLLMAKQPYGLFWLRSTIRGQEQALAKILPDSADGQCRAEPQTCVSHAETTLRSVAKRPQSWFCVSKPKKPQNRVLFSELSRLYKSRPQQSPHKLSGFGLLSNQKGDNRQQKLKVCSNSLWVATRTRALRTKATLLLELPEKSRPEQTEARTNLRPPGGPVVKPFTTRRVLLAEGEQQAGLSPAGFAIVKPSQTVGLWRSSYQFTHTFQQQQTRSVCSTLLPFVHSLRSFSRSNQETCLTQKPLVQEGEWVQKGDILTDCSASEKGELAVGKNVLIAYLPWEGYNFEDAIVVSDRLTKEQIYASLHIERYVCEAQDIKEKITNSNEWFTRNLPGVHPKLVSHLDTFGFPKIGTILKEGDILVGKMRYFRNKPTTPYEKLLSDILGDGHFSVSLTSLRVPKGVHEARVISHRVVKTFRSSLETTVTGVQRPAGTPKVVHIFLGEKRSIQIGDKMSGRHGNKGIISTILPKQDMPYLPDGSPIDILLNPLGVPSRMNVGQIFESLLGLASTYLNQNFKITAFDELYGVEASQSLVYLKLYQARLQSGQNWLFQINFPGKTRLIDGRSGECFDQWVTVGRAYMLKLIHMVNEKIHARNTGPYALITQQPLRGRSQKGGQRLGEMEVWALEGYGAAYILQELLTKKSDDFAGRQEIINSLVVRSDKFSSPDNPYRDYSNPDDPYQRFSDPDNPYQVIQETRLVLGHPEIFKTLICELQALCLDVGVYALKKESFQREYLGIVN